MNSLGKEGIPIKDSYENDNFFFMTISPYKNYLSDRTDPKEKHNCRNFITKMLVFSV